MTRQGKSILYFALPLLLAALYLSTPGIISHSAYAQCSRPGFKLNYGNFSHTANKIATADFNADGKADIAAAYYSGGLIALYFGNGAGGFSAPVTYLASNSISRLVAADVNNDAKPDILLMIETFTTNRAVWVFLNNGSGTFLSPVISSFGFDLQSIQVADFNGDGKGDLVYLAPGGGPLLVRFGDGLGNFPSATAYQVANLNRFVVGDFSGDGKQDVAVNRNVAGTNIVKLYLNDGSGGLVAGMETVLGNASIISLARDFNGDGKMDIAGYSFSAGNNTAMVLLNNGSGGFTRMDYPLPYSVGGVHMGDFNGDGNVDLLAGNSFTLDKSSTLYGNGMGGLTLGESFSAAYGLFEQGDVADFNGDGKSDLFLATSTGVRAFLRTCSDVSNTKRVDYDGDGQTDFAVWRPSNGNWIIKQSSNNVIRTQQWGSGSFGDVPVPGDYDGDDKSDLAVFRAPAGVWYVLRSSDNTFFGIQWGTSGDKPVPGDYDADGKTDVAVFRPGDGGWYILRSSDNALSAFAFGMNGDKPAQADFDNDDKTDVAVFRPSNGYWYILNSSDSSFRPVHFGISADKPVPADYDGDGKADIAIYRPGVGFYFLNSWNNFASGVEDFRYAGTASTADVPAPVKRVDNFAAYIWRPASGYFGYLGSTTSGAIGTSGDIPVVAPYVIE